MKIEVKLKPEIFGILPHQMVSQDQCSIIWEPSLNSFADWWCSMYVGREMYKQKSFTVLDSYKKLYNHWDSMDGHEELKKQTQKIRRIITEINEYIEDPKDYFPLNPKEVNEPTEVIAPVIALRLSLPCLIPSLVKASATTGIF